MLLKEAVWREAIKRKAVHIEALRDGVFAYISFHAKALHMYLFLACLILFLTNNFRFSCEKNEIEWKPDTYKLSWTLLELFY